jgi:hypothetical protein
MTEESVALLVAAGEVEELPVVVATAEEKSGRVEAMAPANEALRTAPADAVTAGFGLMIEEVSAAEVVESGDTREPKKKRRNIFFCRWMRRVLLLM